jgi:4-hydroxy-tetrahydrodipicolinate synthase
MSTLTAKELYGCMTALLTPMSSNGMVDYAQWKKLIQWQIRAETTAIVVAGTTGESALLDKSEIIELLEIAVKCCHGTKTKVILGTGHINAAEVILNNEMAKKMGADAVLVVTPYYIRTSQLGLQMHFEKIADESPLPIILYNVPSRTQNDLLSETTEHLSHHRNIIGIKEASNDENRIPELVKSIPNDFSILSGNDDTFTKSMQQGATGVISVASNLRPHIINKICTYMALGDIISAKKCDSSLENLYKMLSCQPNPIPVKYLLHQTGLIGEGIRLPLVWFKGKMPGSNPEIKNIIEEMKL